MNSNSLFHWENSILNGYKKTIQKKMAHLNTTPQLKVHFDSSFHPFLYEVSSNPRNKKLPPNTFDLNSTA